MHEKMDIGEICNREVVFATEDMSIKEAAELMRDQHVGSLVVIREADLGRIVTGMVTDRDIAIVAVARDFDPQSLRVADIMSGEVVTARPDASVSDVLHLMRQRGVRRIPVTTDDGVLIGIVTLDDLLEILAEELQGFVQAITSAQQREARVRG
ncbi:MAG: CBS domain-containing protein [Bacillota bacterium]